MYSPVQPRPPRSTGVPESHCSEPEETSSVWVSSVNSEYGGGRGREITVGSRRLDTSGSQVTVGARGEGTGYQVCVSTQR